MCKSLRKKITTSRFIHQAKPLTSARVKMFAASKKAERKPHLLVRNLSPPTVKAYPEAVAYAGRGDD